MSREQRTCGDAGGRTKDGRPCKMWLQLGANGLCVNHDPERAQEKRLISAAGGRAGADIARLAKRIKETVAPKDLPTFAPDSLERLSLWLQWVAKSVVVGEIDFKVAREVTTSLRELRPVLINIGYERRLKQYEQAVVHWKKTGKPDRLLALVEKDVGA